MSGKHEMIHTNSYRDVAEKNKTKQKTKYDMIYTRSIDSSKQRSLELSTPVSRKGLTSRFTSECRTFHIVKAFNISFLSFCNSRIQVISNNVMTHDMGRMNTRPDRLLFPK